MAIEPSPSMARRRSWAGGNGWREKVLLPVGRGESAATLFQADLALLLVHHGSTVRTRTVSDQSANCSVGLAQGVCVPLRPADLLPRRNFLLERLAHVQAWPPSVMLRSREAVTSQRHAAEATDRRRPRPVARGRSPARST